MAGEKTLPNLVEARARHVGFCVQTPAARAALTRFRVLRESSDLEAGRVVAICGAYRQGRKTHEAIVTLSPQTADKWHAHVQIRFPERGDLSGAHAIVTTEEQQSRLLAPQKVDSSTLRRIIAALGSRLDGQETVVHAEGEFLLRLREWRPLVQIPFELVSPTEAPVGVDLVGVRLAWRDGSRSVIMDTLSRELDDLRVYLRMRSKLRLGGSWALDVVRRLRDCLPDVIQPAGGDQ